MFSSKYLSLFFPLIALNSLYAAGPQPTQLPQEKPTTPSNEQESLIDALKNTEVGGFVYGEYTSMFGKDANGSATQLRLWLDMETSPYHGFSLGSRAFANIGTGGPDGGNFLENSGLDGDPRANASIPVGLMALYGKQTFEDAKLTITAGKMNIVTPFTDYEWDFGYGIALSSQSVENITLNLQAYGVWGLDDYNNIHSSPQADDGKSFSSDNTLVIWGINGADIGGFGFDLWMAHAISTIDFLVFADFNYTISGLTLQTQLATTQVDINNPYFASRNGAEAAKLRGLYNLQAQYATEDIGITAGYTGSFGDGYGALFNYVAGFNMGGNIWWDVGGGNGYGITGVGGFQAGKKANISVAYAHLDYFGYDKLSLGLAYAYVSGNNQYRLMKKGYLRRKPSEMILGGSLDAKLHEVSFTLAYNFTNALSLSALVGSTFGDLMIGKAQAKLNYAF